YTRDYDLDILEEVAADHIAKSVIAIGQQGKKNFSGQMINLGSEPLLRDAYLAFPSIMVAQIIALLSAIKVKNKPDTPSVSGTVNRVVKGVRIHPYGR
ncbi:MAG: tagatose-6-phosphate ketose isomerase, partial [Streptococcus sp.]|nr:tagatose-6-phosphate ketose isomerase [Streptococcus sp.]